jgi:hypothetical protein
VEVQRRNIIHGLLLYGVDRMRKAGQFILLEFLSLNPEIGRAGHFQTVWRMGGIWLRVWIVSQGTLGSFSGEQGDRLKGELHVLLKGRSTLSSVM